MCLWTTIFLVLWLVAEWVKPLGHVGHREAFKERSWVPRCPRDVPSCSKISQDVPRFPKMSQVTVLFDEIFFPLFGFPWISWVRVAGISAEAHSKHSLNVKLLKWGMGGNVNAVTVVRKNFKAGKILVKKNPYFRKTCQELEFMCDGMICTVAFKKQR